MEIVKIIGIGLLGTVAATVVKEVKPAAAIGISIAAVMAIFAFAISGLSYCIDVIKIICETLDVSTSHITTVVKMIGVAYLAEFGAQVCADSGQKAIATQIELAGKMIIVMLSIPVLVSLINLLVGILP